MKRSMTASMVLTALCTTLTIISARVSIPIPVTGMVFSAQVCVVLCTGVLLGPRYGALSQALYVALGLLGFPVFTMGGGLSYMLHPTFAYLVAFPIVAWICGLLACRVRKTNFVSYLWAMLAGVAMLYGVALPTLLIQASITSRALPAFHTFLISYCIVFLPLDVVKAIVAAALCLKIKRRITGIPA